MGERTRSTQPDAAVKVALIASQPLTREAFRALLQLSQTIDLVADCETPASLPPLDGARLEVILFVMQPAAGDPSALLEQLPRAIERAHTLVVSSPDDVNLQNEAIELGAMGIVKTNQPWDVLNTAISKVRAGEIWLDRGRIASIVRRLARPEPDVNSDAIKVQSLTFREREVVALIAEGLSNKQIADRLFISEATARNHLTSILSKLELGGRFHLAVYAFQRGLVPCPQTSDRLRMAAVMQVPANRRRR